MKKIVFFLPVLLLMMSCNNTEDVIVGNKTSMQVQPVFDGGTVVKGEVIKAQFVIKNTGNYPLIIAEVKPGCSCTIADKPEDPIKPGQEGIIKAEVSTKNAPAGSPLSKSLNVVANTEPSVTQLVIQANIK